MIAVLGFGGSLETLLALLCLNALLAYSGFIPISGGSFSLSFVAFVGFGAYVAGILSVDHGIGLAPAIIVAPISGALIALAFAKPLERLSGMYLALVSVAIISIFKVLAINLTSLTGGALGKLGIAPAIGLRVLIPAVAIVAGAMALVQHSALGRAMRMARSDPLAAGSMGINVVRLRMWLFVASAGLASGGGVLRAYYYGSVIPVDYSFDLLVVLLAIVILGGIGRWAGPIVGALVWTLLPEWLRPMERWRDVGIGLVLLVVILALPQGVVGGGGDLVNRARNRYQSRRQTRDDPAKTPATSEL